MRMTHWWQADMHSSPAWVSVSAGLWAEITCRVSFMQPALHKKTQRDLSPLFKLWMQWRQKIIINLIILLVALQGIYSTIHHYHHDTHRTILPVCSANEMQKTYKYPFTHNTVSHPSSFRDTFTCKYCHNNILPPASLVTHYKRNHWTNSKTTQ